MADVYHLEKLKNCNISKTIRLIFVKFGKLMHRPIGHPNSNGQKNVKV